MERIPIELLTVFYFLIDLYHDPHFVPDIPRKLPNNLFDITPDDLLYPQYPSHSPPHAHNHQAMKSPPSSSSSGDSDAVVAAEETHGDGGHNESYKTEEETSTNGAVNNMISIVSSCSIFMSFQ